MHNDNIGAVHLTVLSAMPGRLRLQLEKPIEGEAIFLSIPGLQSCRYNPRIQTMLCCYDKAVISESDLLVRIGALYARLQQTAVLHVKHSEEEGFSMAPSGYLALGCIVLDGMMTLAGSTLTRYTRWLSAGATLTAVVEHAYQELHTRGSFDPEVMSVVYLINAIGKPNGFQASLRAWSVTFSRHLLPRGPREQVYLVRSGEHTTTLTPVVGNEDGSAFAGSIFRRSVEVLAHKG